MKTFKDIFFDFPKLPIPNIKRFRYAQPPGNSSKGTRPHFPRWLRRATMFSKNRKRIDRIAARAVAQGYFMPSAIRNVKDALDGKM